MTRQQAINRLRWLMLTLNEVREDLALDIQALAMIEQDLKSLPEAVDGKAIAACEEED